MNKFTFVIQADETSSLELQLGRFIPTATKSAAASAAAAASSAAAAATSDADAQMQATGAARSASAASTSATAASGSASMAASSETSASASATAASGSVTAAAGSATNAATSATNASSSATAASTSATNAANSAVASAASAASAAGVIASALQKANNLADVADKEAARTNLDVPDNAALTAVNNSKVSKTGDTMSGNLRGPGFETISGNSTSSAVFYSDTKQYNFVIRTGAPGAERYSVILPTGEMRLPVRPSWGAVPWDTGNLDPNSKINRSGDTMAGRLSLAPAGTYGEIGLRSTDGTWQYMRGRASGGGMEWVNNAYNSVVANTDDGGTFWGANFYSRGVVQAAGRVNAGNGGGQLCEDGNIQGGVWGGYLSNWLSGQLGGKANQSDLNWTNGQLGGKANAGNYVKGGSGNSITIGWDGNAGNLNFVVDTTFVAYLSRNVSDRRLKNNITATAEDSLSKIKALTFYQFDWKDTNAHQKLGIIAQQAQQVDPAFVYMVPGQDPLTQPLMYDRDALLFAALHAVQQLSERISALEAKCLAEAK